MTKYRVFIASPADVEQERDAATEEIYRWNTLHSERTGVMLEPLRWETGVAPDADRMPQDITNERLLGTADLLIGIFWGRLGTPTVDFPSGTVEEIKRFEGTKMVYFNEANLSIGRDDDDRILDEYLKVRPFREECRKSGYYASYDGPEDFRQQLKDHLTLWANSEAHPLPSTAIRPYSPGNDEESLIETWGSLDRTGTILLYNPELYSFRDADAFRSTWNDVAANAKIKGVCMLLPKHKLRRLLRFVSAYRETFKQVDGEGFFRVCVFDTSSETNMNPLGSGVSFALFRFGDNPASGEIHHRAMLFILSAPFSRQLPRVSGSTDVHWEYQLSIELVDQQEAGQALRDLWSRHFKEDTQILVSNALSESGLPSKPILDEIKPIVDTERAPPFDEVFDLSLRIRASLFDPNVPTYILNSNFFLLDWNPTFELIFPTETFRRGENVSVFLECLSNYDDTLKAGKESFMDPSNYPVFHEETFEFESPSYGHMEFTKVTSPVYGDLAEIIGWNVALNIDIVDKRSLFEEERQRVNELDALQSKYAPAYERVVGTYSGYSELAELHTRSVSGCTNVLDLGAGPGYLTERLLRAGKSVTALDMNDSMLRILRNRCVGCGSAHSDRLRVVKMNIERLSAEVLDNEKFDGVVMLNSLYQFEDPRGFIHSLREVLLPGAMISVSGPRDDADVHTLFQEIENEVDPEVRKNPDWTQNFLVFKQVNFKFARDGILHRLGRTKIEEILQAEGFSIVEDLSVERLYAEQGTFVVARYDEPGEDKMQDELLRREPAPAELSLA